MYPVTVQSFNSSNNLIQSFKYSAFHRTVLNSQEHAATFRSDCNNFLKTCLCCCRKSKLSHVPKFYFAIFYRAFKKSNSYVATLLISVVLTPFKL